MKFSIVIPLYNEAENILNLLTEIKKYLKEHENYEIILIDDYSSDHTKKIINNIKDKNLKLIKNNQNKGQSYSIHKGILQSSFETIITLDGDGQNDPADIPKLLDCFFKNKHIELIGGIRSKRKDSFIKIFSSKVANLIRARILNDGCPDTGCSLKVFNKNIFLLFPYFDGMHRFLPALFKGYGYSCKFINVNHRKRKYGNSKYGVLNRLFKGIRDIIKVRKIIKNKKLK